MDAERQLGARRAAERGEDGEIPSAAPQEDAADEEPRRRRPSAASSVSPCLRGDRSSRRGASRLARRAAAALRPVLFLLAVFAALWAGLGSLEAKESEELRLRVRVREFTASATTDLRRDLIVREIADADPAALARCVRDALTSDARRAAALDLAVRMRLPGVFDAAKRWADAAVAPQVLALALAAPDDAAAAWLVERWTTSDPATDRFRAVDEALRQGRAAPGVALGLAPSLADPVRAEAALAVLRAQMAVDDACPADLRDRWDEAWRRYVFESRPFPRDGEDLLAGPGWRLHGARAVGRNVRVAAAGSIDLAALPLPLQVDGGTLRLRVAAGTGTEAFVSLRTGDGGSDGGAAAQDLRLRCDGTWWYLVEGPPRDGARVEAPFRPGDWSEVEVRMSDPKLSGRPGVRDLRVFVDGVELRPSGGFWRLSSPPASLTVAAATGTDPTLVGGVTWRRAAP